MSINKKIRKKINKTLAVKATVAGLFLVGLGVIIVVDFSPHAGPPTAKPDYGGFYESKFQYADLVKPETLYPVSYVIDGDTLIVNVEGNDVTLRLIGIDTPETVDPRKPVQCFGPEASVQAKTMLASTSVYIELDPQKGNYEKYGRVLAYVSLADGSSYNEYMLKNGFAREYTFNHESYKYQKEFKADESAAKKAHLGLWGKCSGR